MTNTSYVWINDYFISLNVNMGYLTFTTLSFIHTFNKKKHCFEFIYSSFHIAFQKSCLLDCHFPFSHTSLIIMDQKFSIGLISDETEPFHLFGVSKTIFCKEGNNPLCKMWKSIIIYEYDHHLTVSLLMTYTIQKEYCPRSYSNSFFFLTLSSALKGPMILLPKSHIFYISAERCSIFFTVVLVVYFHEGNHPVA